MNLRHPRFKTKYPLPAPPAMVAVVRTQRETLSRGSCEESRSRFASDASPYHHLRTIPCRMPPASVWSRSNSLHRHRHLHLQLTQRHRYPVSPLITISAAHISAQNKYRSRRLQGKVAMQAGLRSCQPTDLHLTPPVDDARD